MGGGCSARCGIEKTEIINFIFKPLNLKIKYND